MRRRWLLAAPAALAGCSVLPDRPYIDRRDWPLTADTPPPIPPRRGARTVLVRTLRASAGTEKRGLQIVQADGSIHTDYYEQWSVPPPDAVEDALRRWLAASGLFSAVLAPGTRATADYALEGGLLSALADPGRDVFRIALNVVLIDLHPAPVRVVVQADIAGQAPLASAHPPAVTAAGRAALADLLATVTGTLAHALP